MWLLLIDLYNFLMFASLVTGQTNACSLCITCQCCTVCVLLLDIGVPKHELTHSWILALLSRPVPFGYAVSLCYRAMFLWVGPCFVSSRYTWTCTCKCTMWCDILCIPASGFTLFHWAMVNARKHSSRRDNEDCL